VFQRRNFWTVSVSDRRLGEQEGEADGNIERQQAQRHPAPVDRGGFGFFVQHRLACHGQAAQHQVLVGRGLKFLSAA
jgi:hypothetical protein